MLVILSGTPGDDDNITMAGRWCDGGVGGEAV